MKMCESWCTCVCAPHFFFFFWVAQLCKFESLLSVALFVISVVDDRTTLFFVFCLVCLCGARIDNNRREYCEEKLRKLVYMRVCSAFFSFLCTTVQIE